MKAATMWQRRGKKNQETIGGTTLVSVCGYVNVRVCAAPLCHLSPLALRSCLNRGGGYPFQSRTGRMSVQLQKYETSVAATNPTCDPPEAKPATFISWVIWLFGLGSRQTQKAPASSNRGESGEQRQRFCGGANHKAPWWLCDIHSLAGAELRGGQLGT